LAERIIVPINELRDTGLVILLFVLGVYIKRAVASFSLDFSMAVMDMNVSVK
jgi:hypothetical protein